MSRARILIVDDNVDLAEGLRDGLEEEGCITTMATSAEDAIKLCRSAEFDLILMDVKLPGIDGIGGLIEIQKINPDSRIVVMSGYKIDTLLNEAIRRGATSVLQKPFSVEQVLEIIREIQPTG